MRLTKENYELLMFDLLEGNLPEADELTLIKQIEGDEFFFKEWNAFKATILPVEEDVLFEKKELLYKEEEEKTTIIPMRIFYRAAVAAAVIFALGIAFFQIQKEPTVVQDDNKNPVNRTENTSPAPKDPESETASESERASMTESTAYNKEFDSDRKLHQELK